MSDAHLATPFPERASAALRDGFLQEALSIATTKFIDLRREAFAGFPQGEALRDRARRIKEQTLLDLDAHLERLADSVERLGGHVHWAATAEEAREIVLRLCREHGVRTAVKSKSMATEEIDLNEALEHAGVTPIETDLGEYIIQLAHERPSHIIAPAIHKTKGQVAELFSKVLGGEFPADPEVLTAAARTVLRQRFLEADMGITGANFAVAETGTVVLVTNEGNGRMVTSLPRVHVAVMGMEKVIPTMTDLVVFLYEANDGRREIHLDGRPLPTNDPQPFWYGYSTGRWEGDTLVVESNGFKDQSWIDEWGTPGSDRLRLTERIRRPTYGTLEIQMTVEDPKTFTKPFSFAVHQRLMPDDELIEFVCGENNLSAARLK